MKREYILSLMIMCCILTLTSPARSQTTGSQTITIIVQDINELSISGTPGNLTVSTATAGSQPNDVTDSTTTYSLTTNCTGKKITGALNSDMPSGVTLKVNLAAPSGATSLGDVTLSTTPADLVTGITEINATGLTITYRLTASVSAGIVGVSSKSVTFTISN